mgnify:CR=1 FL=1
MVFINNTRCSNNGCRPCLFQVEPVLQVKPRQNVEYSALEDRYAAEHGHRVCTSPADVVPLLFGTFYHDSIEDARLTYNDVMSKARCFMNDEQALAATEIVYALTNDKGRTRAERAGEKYYAGIRSTPYAPFVKLCDRMANVAFTCSGNDRNYSVIQSEGQKLT